MLIEVVSCLADNYAYLVTCEVTGRSALIDPSEHKPVERALSVPGRDLAAVLCTHHHLDHVGGVLGLLSSHPRVPVFGSSYDLSHGRITGQTHGLTEAETFSVGELEFRAMLVPGHTLGAVAFLVQNAVFTGDTLFAAGCGRLFEGTAEVMQRSLMRLGALDADTRVFCGHEYTMKNLAFGLCVEPRNACTQRAMERARARRARGEPTVPTTVADEARTNVFLRVDCPAVREHFGTSDAQSTFAAARRARDEF